MRKQYETVFQIPGRKYRNLSLTRRQLLKTISAAAGYSAAYPLLASTTTKPVVNQQQVETRPDLPGQVEFRFTDSKSIPGMTALGQGTIVNRSISDIVVTDISPSILVTENGHYDVSAYLAEFPTHLGSGQQHHFWVRPVHANTRVHGNRPLPMHGSLNPLNTRRTRVLARIDSPSMNVEATEQPFELTISTRSA